MVVQFFAARGRDVNKICGFESTNLWERNKKSIGIVERELHIELSNDDQEW